MLPGIMRDIISNKDIMDSRGMGMVNSRMDKDIRIGMVRSHLRRRTIRIPIVRIRTWPVHPVRMGMEEHMVDSLIPRTNLCTVVWRLVSLGLVRQATVPHHMLEPSEVQELL